MVSMAPEEKLVAYFNSLYSCSETLAARQLTLVKRELREGYESGIRFAILTLIAGLPRDGDVPRGQFWGEGKTGIF